MDHAPVRLGRGVVTGGISIRVVGTMTRPVAFPAAAASEVLGVRFNPGGASGYFRVPARELTDQDHDLAGLWGAEVGGLVARLAECWSPRERLALVEALLLRRRKALQSSARCALQVAELVVAEAGQMRIGRLAERAGYSRQYLARLFDEHVGVAPKLLARIERFSSIVTRVQTGAAQGWADAAAAHGYYDQAHFIHEFTEFAGVTPTAYFARE